MFKFALERQALCPQTLDIGAVPKVDLRARFITDEPRWGHAQDDSDSGNCSGRGSLAPVSYRPTKVADNIRALRLNRDRVVGKAKLLLARINSAQNSGQIHIGRLTEIHTRGIR